MAIRRMLFLISTLTFLGYGALLISHASFAVGGSDSSGYANTAKMIVSGTIVQPVDALDRLGLPDRFDRIFMPLAHEPGPRPRTMVPYYPPGFSLHFAAAGALLGWDRGPFLVSPLAALLLVMVTYFLGRELTLQRPLAFACAAIVGGSAVLLSQAEQAMSDVAAALWVAAALLFALRSRRNEAWALGAGAAFGMAVLVRPTNVLAAIPLCLALGWRLKTFALFVTGGLPFAAFQFWWNGVLFGSFLRTGYGGLADFKLANFPARFSHYTRTLVQMFSPLVPLGWLGLAGARTVPFRVRGLLICWFLGYFLLYCFWGPYEAWWYTRYFLPAFPALVIGAVLVARDLFRLLPDPERGPLRPPRLVLVGWTAMLLVVANAERVGVKRWHPLDIAEGERTYPMAMDLARSRLPERSLIVSMQMSGALRYYTHFQPVRWDWLDPADFPMLRAMTEGKGYRWYALLAPFEEENLGIRAPGKWREIAQVRDVKLWALE